MIRLSPFRIAFLLVLVLMAGTLNAQKNVPWKKSNFKDDRRGFRKAFKKYVEAEAFFAGQVNGFPQYKKALELYQKAYKFNPNSAMHNFKMGACYLNTKNKAKSMEYLQKAKKLKPGVHPDLEYFIAQSHQLQYEFEAALRSLELYRNRLETGKDTERIIKCEKKKKECHTALKLTQDSTRVWIDNLGDSLNSSYPEYSAFISADESVMLFTGRKPDTKGGGVHFVDNQYFEDIYVANYDKETNNWREAQNIGDMNRKSHDATAGLSHDGKTLFVYYGDEGGGDIYISKYVDGEWTKPDDDATKKNINSDYRESSAALSFDGQYLYFTSARDGTRGKRDLWKSKWNKDKERWGEPKNLGGVLNTRYDEAGVYFHPDGKTLYFSSKGHNTMGGFDIFSSVQDEDGNWSEPKNIGYPINTPDDDVFFVMAASGRHGYYSSIRDRGLGEKDIYRITFLGPEKPPQLNNEDPLIASIEQPIKEEVVEPTVEMPNSDVAILTGIIRDAKTLAPQNANIELVNNEENEIIAEFSSDSETGEYLISLPSGENYGIAVKSEGYLFHSENFNIPDSSGYKEYELNIDLKKLEVGKSIILENIFFDLDKYTLRDASKNELQRLNELMEEYKNMRIEISGHTDIRASDSYNQKLSENRAKAVVDYLVEHGIDRSRMEYVGYGEKHTIIKKAAIDKMKTKKAKEAAHQKNRRTEFKILSL